MLLRRGTKRSGVRAIVLYLRLVLVAGTSVLRLERPGRSRLSYATVGESGAELDLCPLMSTVGSSSESSVPPARVDDS